MLKADEVLEKWETVCKATEAAPPLSLDPMLKQISIAHDMAEALKELCGRCDACPQVNHLAGLAMKYSRDKEFAEHKLGLSEGAAASMREALEDYRIWHNSNCSTCSNGNDDGSCKQPQYCHVREMQDNATAALSSSVGREMLERMRAMEGLLREIAQASQKAQDMMRREGFVIDNLEDRWQKLAFTLYTRLVQLSCNAEGLLDDDDDPGSDPPLGGLGNVENEEPKEGE